MNEAIREYKKQLLNISDLGTIYKQNIFAILKSFIYVDMLFEKEFGTSVSIEEFRKELSEYMQNFFTRFSKKLGNNSTVI